jgi:hypothetical protein
MDSLNQNNWYQRLTPAQNQQLMALGQGMFNLMLRHITAPAKRAETLEQARRKGEEFGEMVAGIGLPLTDSVEAFIQHRGQVMHFITRSLGQKGAQPKPAAEAFSLVTRLMDEALIAMINTHQRLYQASEEPIGED